MGCPNKVGDNWQCDVSSLGARSSGSEVSRDGQTRRNYLGHPLRGRTDTDPAAAGPATAPSSRSNRNVVGIERPADVFVLRATEPEEADAVLLARLDLLAQEVVLTGRGAYIGPSLKYEAGPFFLVSGRHLGSGKAAPGDNLQARAWREIAAITARLARNG